MAGDRMNIGVYFLLHRHEADVVAHGKWRRWSQLSTQLSFAVSNSSIMSSRWDKKNTLTLEWMNRNRIFYWLRDFFSVRNQVLQWRHVRGIPASYVANLEGDSPAHPHRVHMNEARSDSSDDSLIQFFTSLVLSLNG